MVSVEGGICHVDNRFASGGPVFADPEEARELIERFVSLAADSGRKTEEKPDH